MISLQAIKKSRRHDAFDGTKGIKLTAPHTASTSIMTRRLPLWVHVVLGIFAFDRAESFSYAPPRTAIPRRSCPSALCSSFTDTETARSHHDNTTPSITNVTITVPRFYEGEVPDGLYPSPLHSIHVESLLKPDQAAKCRQLAKEYAAESGSWNSPDNNRHHTYATCDFPLDECESLSAYLEEIDLDNRILSRLSKRYNVDVQDMGYLDLFCAHYQAKDNVGQATMDRLEPHRDGSLLSFTVLLTPPKEFEGGGTSFDALRDVDTDESTVLYPGGVVRPPQAGDCVLHSGKLLHGADTVTSGERTVLVGFIEVADRCTRPDVLAQACTDFGRMDVAAYRYRRQEAKTSNGESGWILNNSRWLPDSNKETGKGRSFIRGFCPKFPSVAARADPEYQRQRKLEAEDVLLRTILLPEKRQVHDLGISDDEITIL